MSDKITSQRSEVRTREPWQEGHGSSRSWARTIRGTLYSFTAVLMPDGERRYFVKQYNGYIGGPAWGCAWMPVRQWIIKP